MRWKEKEGEEKLVGRDVTTFRALAARANYLALDRPDIQYSVKEICRGMANPARSDLLKMRRLARYLIGRPRLVIEYRFQGEVDQLHVYSDSDWAGCRRTAKSTSGGVAMRGGHCLWRPREQWRPRVTAMTTNLAKYRYFYLPVVPRQWPLSEKFVVLLSL